MSDTPFHLWKLNWILLVLTMALSGRRGYLTCSGDEAYVTGYVSGAVLGALLFVWGIGYLLFRISRRNQRTGNVTVLILAILNALSAMASIDRSPSAAMIEKARSLEHGVDSMRKEMLDDFDTDNVQTMREKQIVMQHVALDGMKDLAASATSEDERRFFEATREFMRIGAETNDYWHESYNTLMSERFLNYSLLQTEQEFDWQYAVLDEFASRTVKAYSFMKNMEGEYGAVLDRYAVSARLKQSGLEGFRSRAGYQSLMEELEAGYLDYADACRRLLVFMETQKGRYQYEAQTGSVLFDENGQIELYNQLVQQIAEVEQRLNELNRKRLQL